MVKSELKLAVLGQKVADIRYADSKIVRDTMPIHYSFACLFLSIRSFISALG